jgi:hypothetical protein
MAQNDGPANDRLGETDQLITDFDPNRVGDPDEGDEDVLVPANNAVPQQENARTPAGVADAHRGESSPGNGTASGASLQREAMERNSRQV